MSKRQRRRVQTRRSMHVRQARQRRAVGLPVALAIAAGPSVVPAAAEAANGRHPFMSFGSGNPHLISHALAARPALEAPRHFGGYSMRFTTARKLRPTAARKLPGGTRSLPYATHFRVAATQIVAAALTPGSSDAGSSLAAG